MDSSQTTRDVRPPHRRRNLPRRSRRSPAPKRTMAQHRQQLLGERRPNRAPPTPIPKIYATSHRPLPTTSPTNEETTPLRQRPLHPNDQRAPRRASPE